MKRPGTLVFVNRLGIPLLAILLVVPAVVAGQSNLSPELMIRNLAIVSGL